MMKRTMMTAQEENEVRKMRNQWHQQQNRKKGKKNQHELTERLRETNEGKAA